MRVPHAAAAAIVLVLLIPVWVLPGGDEDPERPWAERAIKRLRKETIPEDLDERATAGYYEDLFEHSSRTISTNRLVTGQWATNWSRWEGPGMHPTNRRVDGFLYYEPLPDLDVKEFRGRLRTNRHGMADREYAAQPPEGVRRIGLVGDSIARGLGATPGKTFEALLEEELNATEGGVEILNFAVGGYRITQLLHVLRTRASAFSPHAYVVALTDFTGYRRWADHLVQLVHEGIDPEYPYLRELARRADLRPDDDPATFDAKLEPYRDEAIHWVLSEMRDASRAQGADLLILLIPIVDGPPDSRFARVRTMAEELSIPVLDVTDAFSGIQDLEPYRISPKNTHPTDAGHRLLADGILQRLREDPKAWRAVAGS